MGINDQDIGDLIQFCHENRDLVSDLGIIPLYESWEPGVFEVAQHTTAQDVEKMVAAAIPGGVDFIPAGMTHWLLRMRPFFRDSPTPGFLFFAGVHPNCESITFLIPNGESYAGINHYLTKPLPEVAKQFSDLVEKIEPKLLRLDPASDSNGCRANCFAWGPLCPGCSAHDRPAPRFREVSFARHDPNRVASLETPPHEASRRASRSGHLSSRGRAALRGAAFDRFRAAEELQGRHAL